jgi:NAD(P)-dependent dehydrogenase (short-subunit alcohol dehydrogenase family)
VKGSFSGKVVLITGAAAGIGRACAAEFGRRGARVVVSDLADSADGAREIVARIEAEGGEARFVPCDVSVEEDVRRLMDETISAYGRLDVAVNNAGIEGDQAPLAEQPEENYERVLGVNLHGTWLCMKHELPHLGGTREDGSSGGAIVNLSSIAGVLGMEGIAPYVASKHGIIGLTRTAALEYAGAGVRVNAVLPAAIQTDMIDRFVPPGSDARRQMEAAHPLGRFGTPGEVAAAVLWLASDDASFVTGHSLLVDGGYTIQ